ncbi:MAG: GNAT family N-acetyltransferase [Acidobacteriota bacterium]|nr:GNAT family N-acetyltransferase [Acidobacteriota bacterium]
MSLAESLSRVTEFWKRHGLVATVRRAAVDAKRAIFARRMAIYSFDFGKQTLRDLKIPSSFTVHRVRNETELSPRDLETLIGHWNPKLARRSINERFLKDASLWVVRGENQLAGYCWTMTGKPIAPYYFPLAADDVQLFDVFVLPKSRGGAVAWYLIMSVLHALKAGGAARVYADMGEWNRGSLALYDKLTPFRRLGTARTFTLFGLKFITWDDRPATQAPQKATQWNQRPLTKAKSQES